MKRTWFCNFAAKYNWLLCSRTNTFLLNFPLFWTGLSLTTTFASMMAIATWSTSPVGTSCLRWCSANLVIVRVFVIWLWLFNTSGQAIPSWIRSWTYRQNDSCVSKSESWLQDLRGLRFLYDEGSLREANDQHLGYPRKEICLWFNYYPVVSGNIPMGEVSKKEGRCQSPCLIWHWGSGSGLLYCDHSI